MTIAIAIRTNTAVVFAADSKLTTAGVAGYDDGGKPQWLTQTYDNATKVIHDRNKVFMAIVAGIAQLGNIAATDFIAARTNARLPTGQQTTQVTKLANAMAKTRADDWKQTQVPEENWPSTIIMLAASPRDRTRPRVWHITLKEAKPRVQEILESPGLYMQGSYSEVFTLLYGYDNPLAEAFQKELGIPEEQFWEAWRRVKVLRPIDKLAIGSMPIQDAIDLAIFIATAQVQMDRFLPGTPVCGGPIDVMVLKTAPTAEILSFPGKTLHHPLLGN